MTSNTSPSGTVSSSSTFFNGVYPEWRAFNGDSSTNWLSNQDVTDAYLTYTFPNEVLIKKIDLVNSWSDNWSSSSSTIYVYAKSSVDNDFIQIGKFTTSSKTFSLLNQELEEHECHILKVRVVGNGSYVSLSRIQVYGYV